MAKKYIGIAPLHVEVEDITELDNETLKDLSVGDFVVQVEGDQKKEYRVSQKTEENYMHLVHASTSDVEDVMYAYDESGWVYDSTITTELGAGGTKLYQHDIELTGWKEMGSGQVHMYIVSTNPTPATTLNNVGMLLIDCLSAVCSAVFSTGAKATICNAVRTIPQIVAEEVVCANAIFGGSTSVVRYKKSTFTIENSSVVITNTYEDKTSLITGVVDVVTEL